MGEMQRMQRGLVLNIWMAENSWERVQDEAFGLGLMELASTLPSPSVDQENEKAR